MFTEGIFPIGDGLLDIDETRLKSLLVQDDINEIYDIEQNPFARGKFAAVRRAVHKNSGVHFAAKFLKRRRRAQSSDKEIKHEIAVLTLCDGAENIVKLNAVHESRSDTALLLELATGGELQTLLDNEECLSEAHARFCMREVLKALQFLHKRSIAHLDLKPQNILLIGEQIEDGLKLCDFGISRVIAEGTNVREILGTPDYVAPEVLQYEPLSLLTDIWSVGVLTYVLLSGFSPFGGDTKQETFLNISQCALTFPDKLFGGASAAAIDFIRRALRIKPSDRMTAAGCLEHIWLKDECSIERHIFESNKSALTTFSDKNGHDEDILDDDDDDDENVDDEVHDVSIETDDNVENDEEEEYEKIAMMNGVKNKMMTTVETKSTTTNGTFKNTVVHTVPAARATTIPLCNAQQQHQLHQHQQQQREQPQTQQAAARRHSTDSNKENTYLSSKKILPAGNSSLIAIGKKSAATTTITTTATSAINNKTTTTATIILGTDHQQHHQQQELEADNVIATIKLPNGNSSNSSSNGIISTAAATLFPDAPTTPKVIRKAPNTDDDDDDDDDDGHLHHHHHHHNGDGAVEKSPTSVKALVKKFQLEGSAEKHLKESLCNHQHQQHQHQPHLPPHVVNHLVGPRKSLPTTMNGKMAATMAIESNGTTKKQTYKNTSNGHHQHQNQHFNNNNSKHISNMMLMSNNGGNRRLSEPLTAVHHQQQKKTSNISYSTLTTKPMQTQSPPLSPFSTASDTATMNYKTTCVYCLTCGSASSNSNSNGTIANAVATTEINGTANGCRHPATTTSSTSADSTITFVNGVSGVNGVNGQSSSSSSTAAAAILLSNHRHHQQLHQHHHHPHHPHHHHHVVVAAAKNAAANNLSIDQGIIC